MTSVSSRQQARLDREVSILDIAEDIVAKEGFSGLTMDSVAARCDFSKGTLYNHFSSKEDLLCGLCIRGMEKILALFQRALDFNGNSREKLLAVHYAYGLHARMNPTLFYSVMSSQTPSVREKANPERLVYQEELDGEITIMIASVMQQAVDAGELSSGVAERINECCFASWALSFGSNALILLAPDVLVLDTQRREPWRHHELFNCNLLFDGMGWKPLSTEWGYQASWQRIGATVFAKEVAALNLNLEFHTSTMEQTP